MTTIKKLSRLAATGLLMTGFAFSFNACTEQLPLQSEVQDNAPFSSTLYRGEQQRGSPNVTGLITEPNPTNGLTATTNNYPQSASYEITFSRRHQQYHGGSLSIENGSSFEFVDSALTPPEGTRKGASVTVTFEAEVDSAGSEMILTFGPSGSTFSSGADLLLNWSALDLVEAKFYYIDTDGNYIEQDVEAIDYGKKWLKAKIYHFSRYAVAWSN